MHIVAMMRPANNVIELNRDDPECIIFYDDLYYLFMKMMIVFDMIDISHSNI